MMLRFAALVLAGLFGVIGYWFSEGSRARAVSGVFDALINGGAAIDQNAFQRGALAAANARRAELSLTPLEEDPEVAEVLARFVAAENRVAGLSLQPLFAALQRELPGAQFLSAKLLLDPRDEGLHQGLASWDDAASPGYATLSTLAFRDGLRKGCLAVLSRRLPPFDLEIANREGGRYYRECPRCQDVHTVELGRRQETLILSCPDCGKPYDLLAAGVDGDLRRATDYFEGFRLPMISARPGSLDQVETMLAVWTAVARHCDYQHDLASPLGNESWKPSSLTWSDAAGDCEDTSVLLADALLSAGIEARVAVGWNIHIGQHAWCVARAGGRQWILESTLRLGPGEKPELVPVAEKSSEYQPEQLVDRRWIYFRKDGQSRAGSEDYWCESLWETLPEA